MAEQTPVRHETDFRDDVVAAVKELGSGDTRVLDAVVERIEDWTGDEAWRLLLVLPRPRGSAWDVEATAELKRRAREILDTRAETYGVRLDGVSAATLTTRDAPESEVAPPDEPEEGESPDSPETDE